MEDGSVVSELINDEESVNLKGGTGQVETSNETPKSKSSDVISAEYVKENGLSETFIGKPYSELGKSYKELMKLDSKKGNEIAELRKSIELLSENASKKEEKAAIVETVDEFGEMPDPINDLEAYTVWMKEFKKNLKSEMKAEILKEISPSLQKANELSTKDLIVETTKLIQDGLPDGEDAEDVLREYIKENKDYYEELMATGRGRTPKSLAQETLKDYKARKFDEQNKLTKEEIDKLASDKAQAQLKKRTNSTKVSDTNTSPRQTVPKTSIVSEIVSDLEAEKD